jgi:uncharacterized protein YecE (DUF72 family)
MIHIGTSGYSYEDWVGPVYPPGTRKGDFLEIYKDLFDACELNFSYYRIPSARTIQGILDKSEGKVTFTVKASKEMTHERQNPAPAAKAFVEGIKPLSGAGKLGCILAQFPFSFHRGPRQEKFVEELTKMLAGLPVVVEFRGRDWIREETFDWLRSLGAGFCCVDEPRLKGLIPPLDEVTSPIGYVRFHGRNAKKWWEHDQAWERYDYLYSEEELKEWVPKIKKMAQKAEKLFIFANNHYQGKAVANAKNLQDLLENL